MNLQDGSQSSRTGQMWNVIDLVAPSAHHFLPILGSVQIYSIRDLIEAGRGKSTRVRVFRASQFAVGDFNGDGLPDLAVVNADARSVSILLSDGKWTP